MPKQFYIFASIIFFQTYLLGQNNKQPNTVFHTNYFDAVDHWVVLPEKEQKNEYVLGFIYVDEILGFTFIFENILTKDPQGNWRFLNSSTKYIVKRQLDQSSPQVALLSPTEINELHLPIMPDWLQLFENTKKTAADYVLKGYQYNAIGKSTLAIPFLEKAYAENPKTRNVAFELAYAYNATFQYEKAILILYEALSFDSMNFMLYRELGYALIKSNQLDEAEKTYEKGIAICENDTQKRDMVLDMAKTFFELKDQTKFEKWAAILKNEGN
jgi:tetratricopeptide (TPR) repeat protein